MVLNDNQGPSSTPRHLIVFGFAATLMSAVLLLANLNGQQNELRSVPTYSPLPTVTNEVEPTTRGEIVARLGEIMRIREEAYRFRNADMLRAIYSEDCPCLANDERAIGELIDQNRIWTGIATSVNVRSVRRTSDRLWIVTAIFKSDSLRIETEDGVLVDTEPGGSDLFRFVLVKPRDSQEWLLGLTTALEDRR